MSALTATYYTAIFKTIDAAQQAAIFTSFTAAIFSPIEAFIAAFHSAFYSAIYAAFLATYFKSIEPVVAALETAVK